MIRQFHKIALGYFLLIAILGVLLRLFLVVEVPANYKFLVHTHSHVALLGWVYTALMLLIYQMYLKTVNIERKYIRIFWTTQLTIIGMLLTFPFMGYALFSILFSTLFLFASYAFAWLVFKYTATEQKKAYSYQCIRIALWYMILSSIGPWALGAIMSTAGNESDLYKNAIYFYLHFQYNGWFILALLGGFLYLLEQQNILMTKKGYKQFFILLNIGVILTYGISLLWMNPPKYIYVLANIGALLQVIAFGILLKHVLLHRKRVKNKNSTLYYYLLKVIGVLFAIKLVIQWMGATSYFSSIAAHNVDLIIGYIHWIFLGVVSTTILAFLHRHKLMIVSKKAIQWYLIGFILTEGLIVYKGIAVWLQYTLIDSYFEYLVVASSILMLAIANILWLQFKSRSTRNV